MLLPALQSSPQAALRYLERYVNDGSPSGFSERYKTSPLTDPFGLSPWFNALLTVDGIAEYEDYGTMPDALGECDRLPHNWFLVHPDMHAWCHERRVETVPFDEVRFCPTSSARTASVLDASKPTHIKFHYAGILGRIDRSLPKRKAIAGPELSTEIARAIESSRLPSAFGILPENGARVAHVAGDSMGMVFRSGTPFGSSAADAAVQTPAFSLWSTDRLRAYEPSLLSQIAGQSSDARAMVVFILKGVIDAYFGLLCSLGLQAEFNAQNIIVGWREDWTPCAIILRDLMGIEKDLPLRSQLGLPIAFDAGDYKLLPRADSELYMVRHSFVFDFKVCTYVLLPLVKEAVRLGLDSEAALLDECRAAATAWISRLPSDFFPKDIWFAHDKVLLTGNREYTSHSRPLLR
jgi:hypothetical protein